VEVLFFLLRFVLTYADLVAVFLAFSLVTRLAEQRGRRLGLPKAPMADVSFWLGVGALVGGRFPFVLAHPEAYITNPLDVVRLNMGLSLYGAFGGAVVVGLWRARLHRLSFWQLGDAYAPFLPLGIGLYRSACLLTGDCYGKLAPPPFGIVFPGVSQPRFPAELYEAAFAFGLVGLLWYLQRRPRPPGTTLLAFFILYPLGRTLVDFARVDLGGAPLSSDQIVSLVLASASGMVLLWRLRSLTADGRADPGQPPIASGPAGRVS